MIKGSEVRKADHEIEPFLLDRWSPRAMSGEEISHEELMRLFEAARWAPSSFNAQQWRALYARRGTEHWQTFFDLLVDANQAWAKNAAVLVVFISRKNFEHHDEPSVTHSYDCGAAWENFALQGFQQGLVVHGMEGFDYERARKELRIPDDFQVEAMAAVGRPGPKESLPEKLQARESPNDRRKFLAAFSKGRSNLSNCGPDDHRAQFQRGVTKSNVFPGHVVTCVSSFCVVNEFFEPSPGPSNPEFS